MIIDRTRVELVVFFDRKAEVVFFFDQDIGVTSPNGGRQLDAQSCQKETSQSCGFFCNKKYSLSLVLESFGRSRAGLFSIFSQFFGLDSRCANLPIGEALWS